MSKSVISSDIIADYFISFSNEVQDPITNLKLQKLVYYSQAWFYAKNKAPLFDEDFEAWIHGPVIPSLYNTYRHFGWHNIVREDLGDSSLKTIKGKLGKEISDVLFDIINEYYRLTGFELEQLTHNEDPWKQARIGLKDDEPSNVIIKKIWIRNYYSKFIE